MTMYNISRWSIRSCIMCGRYHLHVPTCIVFTSYYICLLFLSFFRHWSVVVSFSGVFCFCLGSQNFVSFPKNSKLFREWLFSFILSYSYFSLSSSLPLSFSLSLSHSLSLSRSLSFAFGESWTLFVLLFIVVRVRCTYNYITILMKLVYTKQQWEKEKEEETEAEQEIVAAATTYSSYSIWLPELSFQLFSFIVFFFIRNFSCSVAHSDLMVILNSFPLLLTLEVLYFARLNLHIFKLDVCLKFQCNSIKTTHVL